MFREGGFNERRFGERLFDIFEVDDKVRRVRLFGFQLLEIEQRKLDGIEQQAGDFGFDLSLHEQRCDLANGDLDGVSVFEERQILFDGGKGRLGIVLDGGGTALLMVIAETQIADGGRVALDTAG